jgi:hypothetical protein
MFHFWGRVRKLTLVAGCLTFQKSELITVELSGKMSALQGVLIYQNSYYVTESRPNPGHHFFR